MTWTNFASLGVGPGTTPQLDANFAAVSQLLNIPCTVSGTNTLTLTSTAGTSTLSGYANYMNLSCVAAATNTGSVTANFNGFGALNIYKDTSTGPQLLTGGEIVQNCEFTLIYDSALNASAGGFHMTDGAGLLTGQTITIGALQVGTSITNAMTHIYSTLASMSFGVLVPGASAQATVSFSGCQVLDNVIVGLPAAPQASVSFEGFVSASGSIVLRAANNAVAATATVTLATYRLTNIGFVS